MLSVAPVDALYTGTASGMCEGQKVSTRAGRAAAEEMDKKSRSQYLTLASSEPASPREKELSETTKAEAEEPVTTSDDDEYIHR